MPPTAHATIAACYEACREFFALPFDRKARHGAGAEPGQAHGFMSYLDDDEGSECFEAKIHFDQRFEWPANLRGPVEAALQLLATTARAALLAIVDALGLDRSHVDSLLDDKATGVDLEHCSHSALRVWSYTRGQPSGWHCDNTLLTLAPAGTRTGLRVRTLDGQHCQPEERMAADGAFIVFAGDALSYLSGGRVPALMHDVVAPPAGASPPRLSAPFFLRGRRGALLRPPPPLAPLGVEALERNAAGERMGFPWKREGPLAEYYGAVAWTWHSE